MWHLRTRFSHRVRPVFARRWPYKGTLARARPHLGVLPPDGRGERAKLLQAEIAIGKVCVFACAQNTLEYKTKQRVLRFKTVDGSSILTVLVRRLLVQRVLTEVTPLSTVDWWQCLCGGDHKHCVCQNWPAKSRGVFTASGQRCSGWL